MASDSHVQRRRCIHREITGPTPEEAETGSFPLIVAGFFPDVPGTESAAFSSSGNSRYAGLQGWRQDAVPSLVSGGIPSGGLENLRLAYWSYDPEVEVRPLGDEGVLVQMDGQGDNASIQDNTQEILQRGVAGCPDFSYALSAYNKNTHLIFFLPSEAATTALSSSLQEAGFQTRAFTSGASVGGWNEPWRYPPGRYDFGGRGRGYNPGQYVGPRYDRDQGYRAWHFDSYGGQNLGVGATGHAPTSAGKISRNLIDATGTMVDLTWTDPGQGRYYTPESPVRDSLGRFTAPDGFGGVFRDAPYGPRAMGVGSLVNFNWVPGGPGQGHNWNRYSRTSPGYYRRDQGFNAPYGDSYGPNYGVGSLGESRDLVAVQLAVMDLANVGDLSLGGAEARETPNGVAYAFIPCSPRLNSAAVSIAKRMGLGVGHATASEGVHAGEHVVFFSPNVQAVIQWGEQNGERGTVLYTPAPSSMGLVEAGVGAMIGGVVAGPIGAAVGALFGSVLQSEQESISQEAQRQARLASRVAAASAAFYNWAHDQQFDLAGRFRATNAAGTAASGYGISLYDGHERSEAHEAARKIAKRHNVYYKIIRGAEGGNDYAEESDYIVYFSGDPTGVLVTAVSGFEWWNQIKGKMKKGAQNAKRKRAAKDEDESGLIQVGASTQSSTQSRQLSARRAAFQRNMQAQLQQRAQQRVQRSAQQRSQQAQRAAGQRRRLQQQAAQRQQRQAQARTQLMTQGQSTYDGYGYSGYGVPSYTSVPDYTPVYADAPVYVDPIYDPIYVDPVYPDPGLLPVDPFAEAPPGYIYTPTGELVPIGLATPDMFTGSDPQPIGYDPLGNPIMAGVTVVGALPYTPRNIVSRPGVNFQYPMG